MNNVEYSHPMYWHIYATDEEKVEILNTNPHRFYIASNLWTFQGSRRREILDEIKQRALKENKTELLKRIEEVRANLISLETEKNKDHDELKHKPRCCMKMRYASGLDFIDGIRANFNPLFKEAC